MLESAGVIRSAAAWGYLARHSTIHPGVYDLSPTERPAVILRHLVRGEVAHIRVTFPEGFTVRQIAHRLARVKAIADEDAFYRLATTQGTTFQASFPLPAHLEGYLYPDTYRFPVGATDAEIIQQMVSTFDRVIAAPHEAEARVSGRSLADTVNIAAMVEREAETDADRAPIAGVIVNRLARRMRLEIDATVQYAQGVHKTRLFFRDLKIQSPYNTYLVPGLPIGPICNPGRASIIAALHPTPSDYLFYVARPDGSHIFARTFAEHQHNIALVRQHPAAP